MNYCIDYAPVGDSVVWGWDDDEEIKIFTLKGEKQKGQDRGWAGSRRIKKTTQQDAKLMTKVEFLAQLKAEDVIYTELGGAGDKFCLAALNKTKQIFRIPSFVIKDIKKIQQQKVESKLRKAVDETIDILYDLAKQKPEKFYQMREIDERISEIRLLTRAYLTVQRKIRGAAERRFSHITQDLELVGGEKGYPLAEKWQEIMERVTIPERLKYIEQSLKRQLEKRLKELPLAQAIFAPIRGCGPVTQGLMIGEILDIRRFKKLPNLNAYAGRHLKETEPGSGIWKKPQRRKRQRLEGVPNLKLGLYYFVDQINRRWKKDPDNPWVQVLLERKEILRQKHEDYPPYRIKSMAEWWLSRKFLQYIWYQWRRFEGIVKE